MIKYDELNNELINAGLSCGEFMNEKMNPVETLVNTKLSAKPFRLILLKYIHSLFGKELEMVIRALSEKDMKEVSSKIIKLYNKENESKNLDLWTLGNALSIIDDKSTYKDIIKICRNSEFGRSRQMLMQTLRKINTEEAFEILLDSLKDKTIRGHAIEELGKWGDKRALPLIEALEVKKGLYEAKAKKKVIKKLKQ